MTSPAAPSPATRTLRALLLPLLLCSAAVAPLHGQAGTRVVLHVVYPGRAGADTLAQPREPLVLGWARATVQPGQTARALLRAQGFTTDAGALAWLYASNPAIAHVDSLYAGLSIVLPVAPDVAEIRGVLAEGALLRMEVEPALRGTLEEQRRELAETSRDVRRRMRRPGGAQQLESWATPALQEAVVAARTLEAIDLSSASITPTLLTELAASAEFLDATLAALSTGELADEALAARIEQEHELLDRIAEAARSGGAVKVDVKVRVNPTHPTDLQGLRLYYATEDERDNRACTAKGPPCRYDFDRGPPDAMAKMNATGRFFVWAERGGKQTSCDLPVQPLLKGENDKELRVGAGSGC